MGVIGATLSPAPPAGRGRPAGAAAPVGDAGVSGRMPPAWVRWWPAAILAIAYLCTRLPHLGLLPMVSDEGTYITWGVRALQSRSVEDWLASLEDGKQPLLAWLMPPFLSLIPDRLVAGRLVSVSCGLANLVLLVLLARRLFGLREPAGRWPSRRPPGPIVGWVAAALYVIAPIALVHDRMALYDSLVTTGALLVLWGTLAWADHPGWRQTLLLGLAMGFALLTKLSALFFIGLVPLAVALWRPQALRRWWRLLQAYFVGAAIYSVLYVSPIVGNIQDGNFQRYSLTAGEVLRLPLTLWLDNARFIAEAAGVYLGWPVTLLAVAGLAAAVRRRSPGLRLATLWSLCPLLLFVLTAKLIYSRYFVFCFVVAFLPAAYALVTLAHWGRWRRWGRPRDAILAAAVGLLGAAPGVLFAVPLLTAPPQAPWMNDKRYITDRFQYVESNYAGYGLPEIVGRLRQEASRHPIVVLSRDTTGMPRDGVTAYLLGWPGVAVGFVPESQTIEAGLRRRPDLAYRLAAQGADVYYVLSDAPDGEQERRFRRLNPQASLVLDLPKPGNHSRFQLYLTRWTEATGDVFLDPPPRLGEQVALRGYQLARTTVQPGGTLELTLNWEALARPRKDFTVFTHVVGADGTIWGQKDSPPVDGQRPTSRWRPGDAVADRYEIAIKPDTPAGEYDLVTGMYEFETLQRLAIAGVDGRDGRVRLTRITVSGPP